MRRTILLAASLAVAIGAAGVAQAENLWTEFWGSVGRDYHRNNAWPEPFVYQDRETVAAPFGLMISKGWERQNLLSDHHFEDGALALNQAGQLKIRWILTQAPQQQRVIFVQRGVSPAQTQARLELVQQAATGILPNNETPTIAVSNMDATGWSAETIDAVGRKFQASTPDPRLPKSAGGDASGAGGGASK
ncbi:MAG TPA: hypothetical protein VFE24_14970 [Pirellulales bacterium]|jgi:hypothetical protein|nr:hypothetical protein [Pirellulales bacterium]